jgi:hypothetical protein
MEARSFFFTRLAGSRELSNSADRGSLGSLSAGVGVNLGIEDQDVDILAGSQSVVQTAEADVVCPAVAAEDPHGLLSEVILILQNLGGLLGAGEPQEQQCKPAAAGPFSARSAMVSSHFSLLPSALAVAFSAHSFIRELLPDGRGLRSGQVHAKAELSVVLKQGVLPCRAVAVLVDGVRRGRSRTAPDGGAAGGIGDVHLVAEELGSQLGIRSFAAAGAGAGELKQRLLELAALDVVSLNLARTSGLLEAARTP